MLDRVGEYLSGLVVMALVATCFVHVEMPWKWAFLLTLVLLGPVLLMSLGTWLYGCYEHWGHRLQAMSRMIGIYSGGLIAVHFVLAYACLTQIPPPGAPPRPWWLSSLVSLAQFSVPLVLVAFDARRRRG